MIRDVGVHGSVVIQNVSDRRNRRGRIGDSRQRPAANISSRVLKYLIACEASGRGGEISTAAVELIVEGREHRLAPLSFAQSDRRSRHSPAQSMISVKKKKPMTDNHGRTWICCGDTESHEIHELPR